MNIHIFKKYAILLTVLCCFFYIHTSAQSPETKRADDLFKFKNYRDALTEYVVLFKKNTADDYLSFQIALCYLNLNEDRSIAIAFLEPLAKKTTATATTFFYLAKAYTYANKFEDALKMFQKAKISGKIDGVDAARIEREMQLSKNAIELVASPIQVSFENLGPNINSPYTDYSPFISSNESFLIFNSRNDADGVKKANGTFTADVYLSEVYLGEWQRSKNIGEVINTKANDEQIIGVSADGLTLIYNYDNATDGSGDIFIGPKYDNEIMKPFKANSAINSLSLENAATISPDGKTLYFSSNRAGGMGGFDLYRALVLPDGTWSEALNLGPEINTPYDEDFPNMSMDGNTIYFSSKGHKSMGGFDIFKMILDSATGNWSKPVNVGFPLNDAYDNMNLCMSGKGRYGYVAALRPEGFGDLDLYRVTFNKVDVELSVIKGQLLSSDKTKALTSTGITVSDAKSGTIIGEYLPNAKTSRFCIIIPPGKYKLTASAKNHEDYSEFVTVLGKSSFETMIDRDIVLKMK